MSQAELDCYTTAIEISHETAESASTGNEVFSSEQDNVCNTTTRKRHSNRPLRASAKNMNYDGLDTASEQSSDEEPKKTKSTLRPSSSGPSSNRIRVQMLMSKVRVNKSSSESTSDSSSGDESTPSSNNLKEEANPNPEPKNTPSTPPSQNQHSDPPKGKFSTKKYVLAKYKRRRNFKCGACEVVCHSTKEMNTHYADTHPPLNCGQCRRVFNNPSSHSASQVQSCKGNGPLLVY